MKTFSHTKNSGKPVMKLVWTFLQLVFLLNKTVCCCIQTYLLGTLVCGHFLGCFVYVFKAADNLISLFIIFVCQLVYHIVLVTVGQSHLWFKIGLMNKKSSWDRKKCILTLSKEWFSEEVVNLSMLEGKKKKRKGGEGREFCGKELKWSLISFFIQRLLWVKLRKSLKQNECR